jgi:hypothetical protein
MALLGFQMEKQKIDDKIREIQAQLKGKHFSPVSQTTKAGGGRRELSVAARRRIAAAQRKRWAEHRRRKAAEAKQQAK